VRRSISAQSQMRVALFLCLNLVAVVISVVMDAFAQRTVTLRHYWATGGGVAVLMLQLLFYFWFVSNTLHTLGRFKKQKSRFYIKFFLVLVALAWHPLNVVPGCTSVHLHIRSTTFLPFLPSVAVQSDILTFLSLNIQVNILVRTLSRRALRSLRNTFTFTPALLLQYVYLCPLYCVSIARDII
jgi:hypothetical protein